MGLLDELTASATAPATEGSGLAPAIIQMLANREGGLAGLVQIFNNKGLGEIISSWVSTGPNLPISADQVQHALGDDQVQQLATQSGVPPNVARLQLAELLPRVIDQLTPNGKIPEGSLMQQAMDFVKNKLV
jgi:uncharacterized protein YidB (DUF937 family)